MTDWPAKYFSLKELTRSQTAIDRKVSNDPPPEIVERLKKTAVRMDRVRELLGTRIDVNSGYRGPAVNKLVGGSNTSSHAQGEAVDFVSPDFGTPYEICKAIEASDIEYDQLIYEGMWVHIGFREPMRHNKLTAVFRKGAPTTYKPGIIK